jgi:hypothetical protein
MNRGKRRKKRKKTHTQKGQQFPPVRILGCGKVLLKIGFPLLENIN